MGVKRLRISYYANGMYLKSYQHFNTNNGKRKGRILRNCCEILTCQGVKKQEHYAWKRRPFLLPWSTPPIQLAGA